MNIKMVIAQLGLKLEDMKECPTCKEQRIFPEPHKAFNCESIHKGKYPNDSICNNCSRYEIMGGDNDDR